MSDESYRARNRTHEQIRRFGAVGSLNDGVEITTNGISTRLIAWPANGFQTQSLHVLTLKPGDETPLYRYAMSEEGFLCLSGTGEVFIRDQWATIEAGDIAYFPDNVPHGLRNAPSNRDDFVLISAIAPPVLTLYELAGYYDRAHKSMDFERAEQAWRQATPGDLSPASELHFNDSHPELRAWNLAVDDVRRHGALFNFCSGAKFGGLGGDVRLILWPGYGVAKAGFHSALTLPPRPGQAPPAELIAALEAMSPHIHPISDEVVVNFGARGQVYCGDRWIAVGPNECVMAPCGVKHSAMPSPNGLDTVWLAGGFAAPPQPDIYMQAGYDRGTGFAGPPFERFDSA